MKEKLKLASEAADIGVMRRPKQGGNRKAALEVLTEFMLASLQQTILRIHFVEKALLVNRFAPVLVLHERFDTLLQ